MTTAPARPKRFYDTVAVDVAEGGWAVTLDGKTIRTPERKPAVAPTRALAEALAEEWRAQGEHLDIAAMHLTRLLNVALDRAPEAREALCDEVRRYAETDLVCYLSDEDAELRAVQEAVWDPLRDWAWRSCNMALEPVYGVIPQDQPAESLDAARAAAADLDDFRLTALAHAMGLLGSAVLALALEKGRLTAEDAFTASRIDESHQEARWGVDAEAAARAAKLRDEVAAVGAFLDALSKP